MEFFEALRARRSCRVYTKDEVPDDVIRRALDAALIAPNSSNMQPWEFYWVRNSTLKQRLVEACLSQSTARTAQEFVVCVVRTDHWRRNRRLMLELVEEKKLGPRLKQYYQKVIPLAYEHGPLSLFAPFKLLLFYIIGLFRPMIRGPVSNFGSLLVSTKTVALACENFMLAISAQGFDTCPMEGFDEVRVKKILGLRWKFGAHVAMVISVGKADPKGIWGPQVRLNRDLFVFELK